MATDLTNTYMVLLYEKFKDLHYILFGKEDGLYSTIDDTYAQELEGVCSDLIPFIQKDIADIRERKYQLVRNYSQTYWHKPEWIKEDVFLKTAILNKDNIINALALLKKRESQIV